MISNITNVEILLRLAAAAALGSKGGFERERLRWAAGIRTHMLVCVGSCLIMIVSAYGFAGVLGQEHTVLDPSSVAAQVVSGIGCLGAASTILILIIQAGVKPLEEAYRARNQTVQFKITTERGAFTPEELRQVLSLRVSQIKRFVVESRSDDDGSDEILVLLNKVSSQDIADFKNRLGEVPTVRHVDLIRRSAADNSSAT